ncbi:aldehyde dehydrogenase family protein [Aliikangiella sp. G2MR2-5]|uniref:L-piperidine-6-carboxylate dehydrogenase n=1 Tax=Aliikangiella sp. G2MR2-5 TaxID=2788943 RepID=UPI0018AAD9A5|nr:aldehyde dehydrogenase family protein [Aliikangiella sp. G2MR2-5]
MKLLDDLGIKSINSGACWGVDQWSTAQEEVITSFSPANGEEIAKVYAASESDYDTIIEKAEKAFEEWRAIPAPVRGELVRKMGDALREKKDALGSLVSLEMGKSKAEGDGEVQEMIDMADFAVGQSRMLYGKMMHSERPQHRMYEQWQPLGLVGVISAFNFPVAVWSWNAFIAAICGNVTIWKPSPKTPLTAVAVQHICNDVLKASGYSPIFYMFVDGESNKLAQKFIEDKKVKKMSFTGSSVVGKMVGVKVAERMGKCLLELAGNNALIVDETANLEHAIPAIAFGAVGTAGQRCTTTRRLIVHESIAEKVTNILVDAYKQVTIGDPLDTANLMGPLIDETAVKNFEDAVARAKEQGGEVLFGGNRIDRPGHYVEPTIIRAENDWEVVQNETFAPILYVMTYKTIEEAIALNNGVRQGLSSAMFTQNISNAEKFLSYAGSDCGIANINIGTSGAEIGGAFGGEKDTGGGREAGSDSWKAYMRRQTNTIFWGDTPTLAQGITFNIG